ncbi:amine sulfotransferase-like [Watersipora subatra]|uniref:amine sulfotransferase-like n=1 Tax=Watersipora subatra TaxID=2589382 RepID=UPI00355C1F16
MGLLVELKMYVLLKFLSFLQVFRRFKIRLGFGHEKYGLLNPFQYKGYWFTSFMHNMAKIKECESYENFRPDDVIIVTYPKTGTNFTFEIVVSIYKELGLIPRNLASMKAVIPFEMVGVKGFTGNSGFERPSPRIFVSHLPLDLFSPMVREGKVKVIHCYRNPKDVVCSMFPFLKKMGAIAPNVSWNEFFYWFMEGNVIPGSYFKFLKEWYPYRNNPNMLTLQFEDMKKDLKSNVERIAELLDVKLSPQQLETIVTGNTFENKKKELGSNHPVYRKGKTGGWKSDLTVEQNEMLDEWIQREMEGLEELPMHYE